MATENSYELYDRPQSQLFEPLNYETSLASFFFSFVTVAYFVYDEAVQTFCRKYVHKDLLFVRNQASHVHLGKQHEA